MISKTKLKRHLRMKMSPEVIETIALAKKSPAWLPLAKILAGSRRQYAEMNLSAIDRQTKEGDTVIITGKVLGSGNLNKKIRICSMSFSESAKRKLKGKSEMVSVSDEVKKNPKAEGVKILR